MLKPVIYVAFVLLIVSFILILISATRPDVPSFDDSRLAIPKIKVDDSANGFTYLTNNIPDGPELRNELIRIRMNRQLTDMQALKYKSKYGGYLDKIHKSSVFDVFYSPLITMSYDDYYDYYMQMAGSLANITLLLKIDRLLIRHVFRDGNNPVAIERIETWLRLASRLQNSYGSTDPYTAGSVIQMDIYKEIDNLVDSGMTTEQDIAKIATILMKYGGFSSGLKRNLKSTYFETKMIAQHLCRGDNNTLWENFQCAVTFNENATLKMLYDDLLPYYNAAGKPYKDYPRKIRGFPTVDLPQVNLLTNYARGNGLGASFYRNSECEIYFIINYLGALYNETISNALQIRLAAIQYHHEHKKMPPSLNALVPEYIQAIPRDPYDGKLMRYAPQKKMIYSVGENLKDDRGTVSWGIFEKPVFVSDKKDIVLPIMPIKMK